MQICLLRHAIAADLSPDILRDEDRPLTKKGVEKIRLGALGMARMGLRFDRILTSPILRARQTAEIVAEALKADDLLTLAKELGFGFSCQAVCGLLERGNFGDSVLLVGHQPDLGMLGGWLLGGNDLPLRKGALALIEVLGAPEPRSGVLHWLLAPRQLRALGSGSWK